MRIGLDIGSTTIKCAVLDDNNYLVHTSYERHFSHIVEKAIELFNQLYQKYGDQPFKIAISGSAGMGLAESCGIPFVQEVFATRVAARSLVPESDIIIELGGEDAKILFMTGGTEVRMNGSCAGGTGAFIDQMATLLKLTPTELNEKAKAQEKIYTIASRCGVFAKTDVQPLINQGARTEDICASIFYSVVNQTVAGLAQGRSLTGNIVYLGGPLTFMSELRSAFDVVLKTKGTLPENSLYFVSLGAALYAEEEFSLKDICQKLSSYTTEGKFAHTMPLFSNQEEYDTFIERHAKASIPTIPLEGFKGRAHLGIDAGSTTIKTVLISQDGELLNTTYQPNSGNPITILRDIIENIYKTAPDMTFASVTTTGYGEQLCKEAFNADYSLVETMAHYAAAAHFQPDVDFIIDIGGQDMKCFKIENGTISDIFLNEACSSGCGSFLQTFSEALGEDIKDFAKLGLFADAPVELGSRCTVFMNSSVKQAQKDGASIENISSGLAISVVKNALYKVIRASSAGDLGKKVVVQGGTFYNDAVLRAFEKEMGMDVIRPSIAGLMGAFGAALYGKSQAKEDQKSTVLTPQELIDFNHQVKTTNCGLCGNNCTLTINSFSGNRRFISGNRCERPVTQKKAEDSINIYEYKVKLLESYAPVAGPRGKIGVPLGLNFFETLPFWHTFFTKLGFEVVTSPHSTRKLYFDGQATIPSDTVCYPAKLMHGHINALAKRDDIPVIFYPCMTYNIDEGKSDNQFNCPVVAYYPEVIKSSCSEIEDKTFIYDYVGIHRPKDFVKKMNTILAQYFDGISNKEIKNASDAAYAEYNAYLENIRNKGTEMVAAARAKEMPIIVLAGRPYHIDHEINHGIDTLIAGQGVAVLSEDSVSHLNEKLPSNVLNQWTYHARLYSAANYITTQPDMNLVQLVSFGCGLDAVTTDEVRDILQNKGKIYTQIKIDEIANLGAVNIRLRSLFAALDMKKDEFPQEDAL